MRAACWLFVTGLTVQGIYSQNQAGPPGHNGGGVLGHNHDHAGGAVEGGYTGALGEAGGPDGNPANPECSTADIRTATVAVETYVACSGISYTDLLAVVMADTQLLQSAEVCFHQAYLEETADTEDKVPQEDVQAELVSCVESLDPGTYGHATLDLLRQIINNENKVCECAPAMVLSVPGCGGWARFRHLADRLVGVCRYLPGMEDLAGSAQLVPEAGQTMEAKMPGGRSGALPPKAEDTFMGVPADSNAQFQLPPGGGAAGSPGHAPPDSPDDAGLFSHIWGTGAEAQGQGPPGMGPPGPDQGGQGQGQGPPGMWGGQHSGPPGAEGQGGFGGPAQYQQQSGARSGYSASEGGEGRSGPPPTMAGPSILMVLGGVALVAFGGVFAYRRYSASSSHSRDGYMPQSSDDSGTELGSLTQGLRGSGAGFV